MEDVEAPGELMSAVEAFCRRRATVEAADILSEFLQLPQALLDSSVLPSLLKHAVLERTDQQDMCGNYTTWQEAHEPELSNLSPDFPAI